MSDKDFDVRGEIMKAISATDDAKDRSMLMLMLGVLERVEKLITDDEVLRQRVLNGDYPNHSDDHDWIKNQRQLDCHAICNWAKGKMAEEETARKTAQTRVRKVIDKALEHGVTVLLTSVALYMGFIK